MMEAIWKIDRILHRNLRPENKLIKIDAVIAEARASTPQAQAGGATVCPDDCKHKKGRFCLLGTNHCTRMAEDMYCP
jgi:hypothetical protein